MGVVESQVPIGSDPRNLELKLKREPEKQESSPTYAPGFPSAQGIDSEQSSSSKTIFGIPMVILQGNCAIGMREMRNISVRYMISEIGIITRMLIIGNYVCGGGRTACFAFKF